MIQDRKECFVCGSEWGLEEHHIFFGRNRKNSTQDGLTCWLCYKHHRGDNGVHHNRALDLRLKQVGQFIYEQDHTREEFMSRYGRNYEETEGAADHSEGAEVVEAEAEDNPGAASHDGRGTTGDAYQESEENVSDYYPKSEALPRDVYNRVLWLVRGYDRLKEEAEDLITQSKSEEPKGGGRGDPTVQAAIRRERIMNDIRAIEMALAYVPEEYREIVFKSVKDVRPLRSFPGYDYASEKTWRRWRSRFIHEVAINKGWWW